MSIFLKIFDVETLNYFPWTFLLQTFYWNRQQKLIEPVGPNQGYLVSYLVFNFDKTACELRMELK